VNFGLTIDRVDHDNRGNNKYIVTELEGSRYAKLLQRRGII